MTDNLINTTDLKRVYLLFGEERYLVKQSEEKLTSAIIPNADMAMMNHSVFKENPTAQAIIGDCEMLPFMAEHRLVQVKDSGLFFQGKKEESEALAAYIENIPETTVLLFTEEKVDKRGSLYKAVKKYGVCAEYSAFKPKDLIDFVKTRSKNRLQCPDYFVAVVGNSMEKLVGELDKLMLYTGDKKITREDIDNVCSKTADAVIFNMTQAVGKRDTAKALDIYNNMLQAKESPFGILKMLTRQLKLILECKYLTGKGESRQEIARTLSIPEFFVRDYIEQGKCFKTADLIKGIHACYQCDIDIKTGKIPDVLGVELIILSLNAK